jgi:hypothetical protein
MSRAGFSYQITKKILTEMTKEELEKLYDW